MALAERLRWGILAVGSIGAEFAAGVAASKLGSVVAVASRDGARSADFARRHDIGTSYGNYEQLIADDRIDVVYVATPHPAHEEWAGRAMRAGRHVLCEKPLTVNAAGAQRVIDVAFQEDRLLMEAFMYRLHPQTDKLLEMLSDGAIGEPRSASISFGFDVGDRSDSRATIHSMGGGAILDVGCYTVAVARLIASIGSGEVGMEPEIVVGTGKLDPIERVDLLAVGGLHFAGGFVAQVSCAVRAQLDDAIRIYGSDGSITVPRPCWLPEYRRAGISTILLTRNGVTTEVSVKAASGIFTYEADHVAEVLPATESPLLPAAETMANMRTLDRWRHAVGVTYDFE